MNYEQARFNMVEQQIRTWNVLDTPILQALSCLPRERFVPVAYQSLAYTDTEIPTQIKYACAYLAAYLHHNHDALELSGLEDYKNVKIGSLDVTPNLGYGAVGADRIPPMVERYMTGLRISGPGNFAIRRS